MSFIPRREWLETHCKPERVQQKDSIHYPFLYGRYAFTQTSIEPENDIHILLDLFERFTYFPLVISGNWYANSYAEALFIKYNLFQSVHLLDTVMPERVLNMLRSNCYVYIEPNHIAAKNTALAESMYLQLPTIAYASETNMEITNHKAMYYKTPAELLAALQSLHPAKASKLGHTMKKVIEEKLNEATPPINYNREDPHDLLSQKSQSYHPNKPYPYLE
ncbi:MAG: glycosyltransferase [Sediminibacterium sp.]|nr:glycosyltransferase [Sediminibacterium sp.]MBX9778829.1 glycosyltransferase [Chitinophagaceae bacterium]